jgi:c-di-GMP-binding flagellar brake protein YcgR
VGKRMKIIITESQYKMLLESNFESMQSLIDMAFDTVKENCEGGYYIRQHQNYICDPAEMIEEIKVVDVSKGQVMDYKNNISDFINVSVDFFIHSIYSFNNLDNFIYELQNEARNVLGGVNIIITKREVINKRKNFDW